MIARRRLALLWTLLACSRCTQSSVVTKRWHKGTATCDGPVVRMERWHETSCAKRGSDFMAYRCIQNQAHTIVCKESNCSSCSSPDLATTCQAVPLDAQFVGAQPQTHVSVSYSCQAGADDDVIHDAYGVAGPSYYMTESQAASTVSSVLSSASSSASTDSSSTCETGSGQLVRQLQHLVGECVRISSTPRHHTSAPSAASAVYGVAQCCNGLGVIQYCSDSLCMQCFRTFDVPLGQCLAPLEKPSTLDGHLSLTWQLHACMGQTPVSPSAAKRNAHSARVNVNDTTSRLTAEEIQVFLQGQKDAFSLHISSLACRSHSGVVLTPQPYLLLSSPLRPYGQDSSALVQARLQEHLPSPDAKVEPELAVAGKVDRTEERLAGTRSMAATCGGVDFTDLRIDQVGRYSLLFETTFVAAFADQRSFASIPPQPRTTSSLVFDVLPGASDALRVVKRPAGTATGHIFLQQPVVEVVDIGKNRVTDNSAPAVTAICFPRARCDVGQELIVGTRKLIVRQDAIISSPALGLVTYIGPDRLGIATSIKGAVLRYSAVGTSTTEMPIDVGRTPYRLRTLQDVPTVVASGEPFAISVQIVAKLDQAFGWYDTMPAVVTLALFRRRYEYNTPAPLTGALTATVDLDGIARFTDLQVAEISGDLLRPERVFFLSVRCNLQVDGINVDLSAIQSPYFLAKPGPPAIIRLNSALAPSITAGEPLPVSPRLYVTDKNGNLVTLTPVTIFATALLSEPPPAACSGDAVASVVSTLSTGNATEHVCAVNMFLGATNQTTGGGVATFKLSISRSGRHSLVFWSPGLVGLAQRDLLLVTPGAPHHLVMLTQPDQVQARKAPLVSPKVAMQDVAGNTVQLQSRIFVSLVSNASRPHDWIPRSDMIPIMKSIREGQGTEDVKNVVDNDLSTFYQVPQGTNMTFDLLHRYSISKIKLQCAVVRADFNITTSRVDSQGLPSPHLVTVSASRPLSSTHVSSVDLYIRESQSATSKWQLAERFNTPPCTFDPITNRTGFQILELSSPVTFARYLAIVVTSTESGAPGRVAEVNIYGGLAPELRDTGAQGLSRSCNNGMVIFDHLLISDHLTTPPYYLDPLVARRGGVGGGGGQVATTQSAAAQFSFEFTYDTGECVEFGVVSGSCIISNFRHSINGGGQCASCKSVVPVLSVRSDWFQIASAAVEVSLMSAPSDGTTDQFLKPEPTVQIQDALGSRVRHADLYVTTSILRQYADGRMPERIYTQVELTKQGVVTLNGLVVTTSGNYMMQINAGGLNPDSSAQFRISPGWFSQLGIQRQPTGGFGGQSLKEQPIIALQDACGNTLTAVHGILISFELLASNRAAAEQALMSQVLATGTLFGVASFNNITVGPVGTYRITFSTIPDLARGITNSTTTSRFFDVLAGSPQSLVLTSMAGGCIVHQSCSKQPIIQVVDAGGNAVPVDVGGEVLGSLLSHPTQAAVNQSSSTAVAAWQERQWKVDLLASGVATFKDVRSDTTGAFVLQFTHQGHGTQGARSNAGQLRGIVSPVFFVSTRASALKVEHQPTGDLKFPQSGVELLEQPIVSVMGSDNNVVDLDTTWFMAATVLDDERPDSPQLALGTTIVTAANGTASFTNLRIDVTAQCYQLRFALGTLNNGIFTLAPALSVKSLPFAVSIGNPRQILIVREPMGVVVGQIMVVQPMVSITDASGNVIQSDSRSTVTASLINTPPHTYFDADAGLTGIPDSSVKVEIVDKGVATFEGLIVTAASACMQMRFSRLGLQSAESQQFVTVADEPALLIISPGFQPGGAQPGLALQHQPWLLVRDKYGNMCVGKLVETSFVNADLDIQPTQTWQGVSPQPQDALLAGSTAEQVQAGGAKFTDLRIDKAGLYRLNFQSMALHVVSNDLVVQTGVGSRLSCIQVPDGTRAGSSFMFQRPPVVAVQDAGANFVALSNVVVHMYVLQNATYSDEDILLQSSYDSWLPTCRSSFHGQMFIHGQRNLNMSTTAITRAGIATFTGLSFSSISPQMILRFCAKRMHMDDSFSEATTVAVDSSPFDVSGEVHQILLDRHPLQSAEIMAGEVFHVQPVVRLVDIANRNATWCGSPHRAVDLQDATKSVASNASAYTNSSFRFAVYDRDGDSAWSKLEYAAYSSAYGGVLSFEAVDVDGNGVILERELVEYMKDAGSVADYAWRHLRYDTNQDGKWSLQEYTHYVRAFGPLQGWDPGSISSFESIDLSGDGGISEWEVHLFIVQPSAAPAAKGNNANTSTGATVRIVNATNASTSGLSHASVSSGRDLCSVYASLVYSDQHHNFSNISLQGRTQAELSYGVATFTDLFITTASYTQFQRYTIVFSFTSPEGESLVSAPAFGVIPAGSNRMIMADDPILDRQLGKPLAQQPQLYIVDKYGNRVSVAGWIAVSLAQSSGLKAPLLGNSNMTLVGGRVRFTDLRCTLNGTFAMHFVFSNPAVEPLVSASMTVPLGSPHSLALLEQPGQLVAGQYALVQPVVAIVDANENVVPASDIWITVSVMRRIVANYSRPHPRLATFSALGRMQAPVDSLREETSVRGIVRFTNLGVLASIGEPQLQLQFEIEHPPQQHWNGSNLTALPVKSDPFNLTDARGMQALVVERAPPLDWAVFGGQVLTVEPVIILGDINGTIIDSDSMSRVNVTIGQSLPCCGLLGAQFSTPTLGGSTSVGAEGGRVVFTDLIIDKIGKHKIVFSALSGARASVQPSEADSMRRDTVFGGVGEPFGHAPTKIFTEVWLVVRPGNAHKLQVVQEAWPGSAEGQITAGVSSKVFAQQPGVILVDAGGNRIADDSEVATSTITAALLKDPCSPLPACCGGQLGVCLQAFSTAGLAGNREGVMAKGGILFSDLSVAPLGTYSLMFYGSTAFQAVVSTTPLEIIAGPASRLLILRQPGTIPVIAAEIFDTSVAVADDGGNVISNFAATEPMVALLEHGAPVQDASYPVPTFINPSAALVLPRGGVSVFDQMLIGVSSACYRITFSLGALRTVQSDSFQVYAGEESSLVLPALTENGQQVVKVEAGSLLSTLIPGTGGQGGQVVIADKAGNRLFYSEGLLEVSLVDNSTRPVPGLKGFESHKAMLPLAQHSGSLQRYARQGAATFEDLFVTRPGLYRLRFEKLSGRLAPIITFEFSIVIGQPHSLTILVEPSNPRPGIKLGVQPQVGALDRAGNRILAFGANNTKELMRNESSQFSGNTTSRRWFITAELLTSGTRSPSQLSPALARRCTIKISGEICHVLNGGVDSVEAFNGRGQFMNLQMDVAGSDYTIRFASSDGSLLSALSKPLNVVLGEPSRMAILQQPAGAIAAMALIFQPSVMILDRGGNRILTLSSSYASPSTGITGVTVRMQVLQAPTAPGGNQTSHNPSLVALAGKNGTAPIINGMASFLSLAVSIPVPKVNFVFSAPSLSVGTVTSEPFAITLLPQNLNLSVTGGIIRQDTLAATLPPIEIQIVDSNGWVVEAEETSIVQVRVALPSISGVPVLAHLVGTTSLRCVKGRVLFTDLRIDRPYDAHTLEFVVPALPMLVTSPFAVYGASHLLLVQPDFANSTFSAANGGKQGSAKSGHVLSVQPSLLLADSHLCLGSCAIGQRPSEFQSVLQSSYNVTAYALRLFPAAHVTARVKLGTGSRNGKLIGNTQASLAPLKEPQTEVGGGIGAQLLAFVFTDLAVVGPYEGYVLEFECSGLAWPVALAESIPFEVFEA